MKSILDLKHGDARAYFLREESYFNFDLPHYFTFERLLADISNTITGKQIDDFYMNPPDHSKSKSVAKRPFPSEFEDTNYKLLNNKDGKYAWRPFQLIHPALYVSLVHEMTEEANWNQIVTRFKQFSGNVNIKCCSIPLQADKKNSAKAQAVGNWWRTIEQQSIELALSFEYVLHTDIADCYGSIYTHSVPWEIHTKSASKANRDPNGNIGNKIDRHLREMAFGQTNGIPQGSVLMDFIAEMVLGYADLKLTNRIQNEKIEDYKILRYRDDYRIFTNNPQVAEHIAKLLTEILIELGMRLNAQKTMVSNNVIRDSIKEDKLFWITSKRWSNSIQEHLLLLHALSEKFPNSGSLHKALNKYYNRIKRIKETKANIPVLTSMLVDIMYKNPRTYPIASAILSKLLSLLDDITKREDILKAVCLRFDKIPNTGHIKLWLQRLTIKIDRLRRYDEDLCKKVNDQNIQIWNSNWLNGTLQALIATTPIISERVISDIDVVIGSKEVQLFHVDYDNVEIFDDYARI
jgi:RNA-directed DNA polymerase